MSLDSARAPLVYLDSQDFSRFSPSHGDYGKCRAVMDELLVLKERGQARFVFSDIHVFESLPIGRSAFKPGFERMRAMGLLCGKDSLPSFFDVMAFELRCMVADAIDGPRPVAPARDWFSDLSFPEPSRARYKEAVKELTDPRLNRHTRRILERTLSRKGQNLWTKAQAESSATDFMARYPFVRADRARIVAYFQGCAPWAVVREAVKNGLRDIAGFSDWLLDNWEHGEQLVGALRERSKPFRETLLKVQTEIASLCERDLVDQSDAALKRDIPRMIAEEWERFQKGLPIRMVAKVLGKQSASHELRFSQSATPSLTVIWQFMFEVVSRTTVARNARKPKESDFADILHAVFAPQVDIYRSDRFACDVLGRIPAAKRAVLVSSLFDLPSVIENWHASATTFRQPGDM